LSYLGVVSPSVVGSISPNKMAYADVCAGSTAISDVNVFGWRAFPNDAGERCFSVRPLAITPPKVARYAAGTRSEETP